MKRLKKRLSNKGNFEPFWQLNSSEILLKKCKGLEVIKIVQKRKFQEVLGKLKSKINCQRQPFTKYWRLTQVFM